MTYAEITRLMPGRRRGLKAAPVVAKSRETLKTGCVICGSTRHARLACPMRIEDEKTGCVS